MVLEHAPVTGLTLLFSSIAAAVVPDRYANRAEALRRARLASSNHSGRTRGSSSGGGGGPSPSTAGGDGQSVLASVGQMLLEAPPIGPLGGGHSINDVLFASSIIFQARALERRWGSMDFLSFLATASALGVAAMHTMVSDGCCSAGGVVTLDGVFVLSAGASLVPLSALVTRYLREVPALSKLRLRIPGTMIALTQDHLSLLLPLLKLTVAPSIIIEEGTHRRPAVVVDIGLWTRVLLVLLGVVFGLASTRSSWLAWWLTFFSRRVCRPLLNILQPALSSVFGATNSVVHAVPRHMQQQDSGTFFESSASTRPADGGRIAVGSLAGPAGAAEPYRQVLPFQRSNRINNNNNNNNNNSNRGGGSAAAAAVAVSAESIAQIEEMGLPVTREQIVSALRHNNGDVAAAVHALLS